jgi:hypothetical protein
MTLCEVQVTEADQTAFASISTRGSAPVGSAILPSYNALGGPTGRGHVSFNRANAQFLNAGTRTLNMRSNGGLTIVSVLRFRDPKEMERIVDFGSSGNTKNLVLARDFAPRKSLILEVYGSIRYDKLGNFEQNTWLTVIVRYKTSSLDIYVTVNEEEQFGKASSQVPDITYSTTFVGKSNFVNDPYLDADVAGVFVVDEYLSTDASSYVAASMMLGKDLTYAGESTMLDKDFWETKVACTACKPGTFKSVSGSSACVVCPTGKYSVINGSSSNTSCLDCPPGTYLETMGNDELSDCMECAAGKYSVIHGSSSNTTCLDCPPGSYLETKGNDAESDCMASLSAGKLNLDVSEGLNIINLACACDAPATGPHSQNTCPGVCPTTMTSTKNENDKAGSLAVDGLTSTCVETEAAEESRWMIDLQSTRQIWTVRLNSRFAHTKLLKLNAYINL